MSNVDPSLGRDAELHQYATSDLSVEEKLASGASIDDLVAAGVLHDDYDPNSEEYDFTPLPPERDIPEGSSVSDEEFDARMNASLRYCNMAAEYRKKAARLRAERLKENASDTAV
ncbi:MAG: hypothetical protein AAFP20_00620 [Cyanobacteria bacterium J06614_10]